MNHESLAWFEAFWCWHAPEQSWLVAVHRQRHLADLRVSGLEANKRSTLARAIEPGYKIGKPYRISGELYRPKEQFDLVQTGIASWYGPGFHGRLTANGESL